MVEDLISGKHAYSKTLAAAKNPVIILGSSSLQGAQGNALHSLVAKLAAKHNAPLNLLHRNASQAWHGLFEVMSIP